jgi:glucose/arabinose dehydrogenase
MFALSGTSSFASLLPGFRLETLAKPAGFLSAVVPGPDGHIYYSLLTGEIYRLDGSVSTKVATVPTAVGGNEGLLGFAFLSDHVLVTHGQAADSTAEVISKVDLSSGSVTELTRLLDDEGRPVSEEHHGGNMTVGPDGTIYVGVGDFGGYIQAQDRAATGGKIFAIDPSTGAARLFALGFRNPYGIAFDAPSGKLIVADNGPNGPTDEMNLVTEGDNCGWPLTFGQGAPVAGDRAPAYVWPETVAPTGVSTSRPGGYLRGGIVVGSFVTKSLYLFPSVSEHLADPVTIMAGETGPIIDVAQNAAGDLVVATATELDVLHLPVRGDADGDGRLSDADLDALSREIADAAGEPAIEAQGGGVFGSWGGDVNGDGVIDARDLVAIEKLLPMRNRAVRP